MATQVGKYAVIVWLEIESDLEIGKSRFNETKVEFMDDQFDKKFTRDENGRVTYHGMKLQTEGLVQGLVANIHSAHEHGTWDSAEHLRYIIKQLEDRFVKQYDVSEPGKGE